MRRLLLLATLGVVVALDGCQWIDGALRSSPALRAKATIARMRYLGGMLELAQSKDVSESFLRTLGPKDRAQELLQDGWGRPLVVEIASRDGEVLTYRVISTGRDGVRGSCCTPLVKNYDDDAVLEGSEMIQNWTPDAR